MKKLIILILIVAAAVGTVIYIRKSDGDQTIATDNVPAPAQDNSSGPANTPPAENNSNAKTYTLEEVAQHGPENPDYENLDPKQSCWIVIHDKVYAIPDSFTEIHPGGHAIYEGCGTDATTLFETRPSGTGTPHSANARSILEKYYIGDLKK